MQRKWTKEKCHTEALKYKTKSEFKKNYSGAYKYAKKYNILDDICSHMKKNKYNFWTKEKCYVEALKYKNKTELKTKSPGAHTSAVRNKWLDEICHHMLNNYVVSETHIEFNVISTKKNTRVKWTKEKCIKEALKYNNKKDFYRNSSGAYSRALETKILDEICSHMTNQFRWTKEKCHNKALEYKTRKEFKYGSPYVYKISGQRKILNEICSHMIEIVKPNGYWNKEQCQKEALKYKYRIDFQNKSCSSYQISYKNNWLDSICKHMELLGDKQHRCIYKVEFTDNTIYILA